MKNIMEESREYLLDTMLRFNSVAAVYQSGEKTAPVRAIPGNGGGTSKFGEGVDLGAHQRDYIIPVEDWPDDPQAGDLILIENRVYEVATNPAGLVWKWTSGYHKARRVITKALQTETYTDDAD